MNFVLQLLLGLLPAGLKAWLGVKTDVAKEAGADEQKLADLEAQHDRDQADAAIASDVDRRLLREGPGSSAIVDPTSPIVKDNPDFPSG